MSISHMAIFVYMATQQLDGTSLKLVDKFTYLGSSVSSTETDIDTTWKLTKRLEKKIHGNYTRMLRAILNKYWRQHPKGTNYTATCLPSRKLSKLD